MTVAVASGVVRGNGANQSVTSGNLTVSAADASNARIDVISVNYTDGTKAITAGTPASSPKPPSLPANHILIAYVSVAAAATNIQNSNISDRRLVVGDGILSGTNANRPAATAVPAGTLYRDTTNDQIQRSDGTSWVVIAIGNTTLVIPSAAAPSQTAEGSAVWDSDDDVLTIGDGTSRKTLVNTTGAQTLTDKTLTSPVINTQLTGTAVGTGASQVAAGNHTTPAASTSAAGHMNADDKKALTRQTQTGGTVTVDFASGLNVELTSNANLAITLSNGVSGQFHSILIKYGGAHTVTFSTTVKWAGDTTPTWTSTNAKSDLVVLYYDGTNWRGQATTNFNI